jgi:hypothetical protein
VKSWDGMLRTRPNSSSPIAKFRWKTGSGGRTRVLPESWPIFKRSGCCSHSRPRRLPKWPSRSVRRHSKMHPLQPEARQFVTGLLSFMRHQPLTGERKAGLRLPWRDLQPAVQPSRWLMRPSSSWAGMAICPNIMWSGITGTPKLWKFAAQRRAMQRTPFF